ncbi:MAG: DNA primase [Propionibacteriaceae bacterium]|nr:DNA primase [Propionibacteriaceae bacterium]
MAGFFHADDLEEVRSRARIDDVVSAYVSLKPAGSGTMKGLCPFHDEKTPSFQVTISRGLYYCFGCGKGGDTVNFVEEINNLSFREAVEFLASKYGINMRYEEQATAQGVSRGRLLEANEIASQFYAGALNSPEARQGRTFLKERGFDADAALKYGIGFSPRGGKDLSSYLKTRGFTDQELQEAGLMRTGGWDYFQSRLMWPIRDAGNSVLGFGARRLFDDDRLPAKYINTPETKLYHKSQVLYGLDFARSAIGSRGRAVVVEGYTDVMACHLVGVEEAVASCGTAFGSDHAKMIQRLLGAHGSSGKVIFTFDGDEAGRKAALKVFKEDSVFQASTWVAVAPDGLDPCELRIQRGDEALRLIIDQARPLYNFVTDDILSRYDFSHIDARLAAIRECAPLVNSIKDQSTVETYLQDISERTQVSIDIVRREIKHPRHRPRPSPPPPPMEEAPVLPGASLPHPDDRALLGERDALKLMLQEPKVFDGEEPWYGLTEQDFTHGAYRALFRTASSVPVQGSNWVMAIRDNLTHDDLKQLVLQLSVETLKAEATPRHAQAYAARLRLDTLERTLTELKARMLRINPEKNPEEYTPLFQEMISLETQRKELGKLANPEF